MHGKHEVVGSNSTRINFLYGIEKPELKMNTIHIGEFYIYIYVHILYCFKKCLIELLHLYQFMYIIYIFIHTIKFRVSTELYAWFDIQSNISAE